jgi:hypothetical protein
MSLALAHFSRRFINSDGILMTTWGSFPVAGRPRLLGIAFTGTPIVSFVLIDLAPFLAAGLLGSFAIACIV